MANYQSRYESSYEATYEVDADIVFKPDFCGNWKLSVHPP